MAWRPAHQLTDAGLIAEAEAIARAEDHAALETPVTLARHLDPTYVRRRHTNLVARAMASLSVDDGDRLLILMPPQTGKSTVAVVWGVFWWLANHPTHRVIVGSHTNALALTRGRQVRKLILTHGHRYGLQLEAGAGSVADWSLTLGGGMKSVGIGAAIAGSPGDLAVIDDPHKSRAEADSFTRRETVAEWYSGDIIARMAPGAPVVVLMTPWHVDDLRGRLLEHEGRTENGGRWRVLAMPALCTHPDTDPLHRRAGQPLPHPKVNSGDIPRLLRHWEDKRSGTTIRDWASQYQLDPQPAAGALLTEAQLRNQRWLGGDRTITAKPVRAAVAVDPAGGGRDTCGIVGGWLGDDDRLYITHDRTAVLGAEVWGERVCRLAVEIDADLIVVEANYGGDMAKMIVSTAWEKLAREELAELGGDRTSEQYRQQARFSRPAPRIESVHARKGKLLRAEPIAQYWTADRIRTTTYLPELEAEWCTWQPDSTESPGRIDASVHLAWKLVPPVPARADATGAARMTGVNLTAQLRPGQT